ncbi:MAG: YHYH domain-containing protein [Aphanocapsa sp. GSE-SYN-MK-11-07L]|nr:YHYH domain-containing protein [Aphanocapsa sp. GSE-SYN-MK-11-07L]
MKTMLIAVLVSLSILPAAIAHSGRTNSEGCHTNSKTGDYHCH